MLILTGLWEVGRIQETQAIVINSARESARDACLGEDTLLQVANDLLTYLQSAEPTAFGSGHQTSMIASVVTLPANTSGYTCWDNTSNRELFTLTFSNLTNPSISDPKDMTQLDLFKIGVQVPYSSITWCSVLPIPVDTRMNVSAVWASMVDSPYEVAPNLPAQ